MIGVRLAAALAAMLCFGPAFGQEFPAKPLVIIVPQGAGGGTDAVARRLADGLQKIFRQGAVVDNRPSASGTIAVRHVKRAEPDGYTILLAGTTANAVAPALDPAVGYETADDFEALGLLYTAPNVLVVPASFPAKTLAEFVDAARQNPGKYNYGTNGVGSYYHLGIAYLLSQAGGLNVVHVPYKGSNDAVRAILVDEVQLTMSSYAAVLPHITAGTMRPLAHTGATRNPAFPDLPTVMESGYPDYQVAAHVAAVVPKNTPRDRVERLRSAFREANLSKEMTEFYAQLGSVQEKVVAGEYEPFIRADVRRFRDAAKLLGLSKEQ